MKHSLQWLLCFSEMFCCSSLHCPQLHFPHMLFHSCGNSNDRSQSAGADPLPMLASVQDNFISWNKPWCMGMQEEQEWQDSGTDPFYNRNPIFRTSPNLLLTGLSTCWTREVPTEFKPFPTIFLEKAPGNMILCIRARCSTYDQIQNPSEDYLLCRVRLDSTQ